MFDAILLSLVDGQSYKHVKVIDPSMFQETKTPELFEEWTFAFFADGKRIICHAFNIKVIHLRKERPRNVPNTIKFERLIMLGDASYSAGEIIQPTEHAQFNIPDIFIRNFGMLGQLTFATHEGIFITSDYNVTTLILADDRPLPVGISRGHQNVGHVNAHGVAMDRLRSGH